MINSGEILRKFENKEFDDVLIKLYPDNREAINYQRKRYTDMINKSISLFGDTDVEIYSAPGRTEVGGNIQTTSMARFLLLPSILMP